MPPSGGVERDINLDSEVDRFTTADRVALGDLGIRKTVAWFLVGLFAVSNLFMLGFVGWLYANDRTMIAAGTMAPADRLSTRRSL
jgi:hypothetical protein